MGTDMGDTEPKYPRDMTMAELMALPGADEYRAATAERKVATMRGAEAEDIAFFTGPDGKGYIPTYYDGIWYRL